jgi:hypothetical protein
MHFIYLHENRTVEPVEIIEIGKKGRRDNGGGGEPNQGTL